MTRLLALVVLLTLAGCGGETAQLEDVVRARRAELATLTQQAERLDDARRKLETARNDSERFSLWRSDGDPAARMAAISPRLGGARASYVRDGNDWVVTLSGTGGAPSAMAALGRIQGPGFVVTRIEAGDSAWTAALRTKNAEAAAAPGATPVARPSPPPAGMFKSWRGEQLRQEIAALDHEIVILQKIVGETAKVDALQAKIDGELAALEYDPTRLSRVLPAVQPLFAGRTPLLASGTITVTAPSYDARGVAAAGVTGETFAARKPEGWDLRKLEGAAIEVSFATTKP